MSQLSRYKTPDRCETRSVELSVWTGGGLITSLVPFSSRNLWSNKGSVHHQEKCTGLIRRFRNAIFISCDTVPHGIPVTSTFDPGPVWGRRSDERASNLLCHFTYSSVLKNLYQGILEKGFCPRVYITLYLFSASKYFRL